MHKFIHNCGGKTQTSALVIVSQNSLGVLLLAHTSAENNKHEIFDFVVSLPLSAFYME